MAISLDSIATGVDIKPPKICLYGVGGIGKTSWAAGAPNPIFAFTEKGQGMLNVARFPFITSFSELIDCVGVLYNEKHDYQSFVIDTIDFAEPLLWKHTSQKYNQDNIESFGFGKGYGYAVDEARVLFQGLDALRDERGMSIILLCHSDVKRFESPDAESYDRYQLSLQKQFGAFVRHWTDCLLFANYKAHVVKDTKSGFGKDEKRARGVGTGERIVYTEERPAHWAKNRYGLPTELPLSWQAFESAIQTPTPTQEEK